tara:strand:- start:632 stop:2089 length:1458 start_codon:yes stop_codon:yes gene_type:complete
MILNIYPNYTQISGDYDSSVVDQATRFRKSGYRHVASFKSRQWDGYTRLFSKSKGLFPTGLKDRVMRIYKKKYPDHKFVINDHRVFKPNKEVPNVKEIPLEGVTLRKHQVRAGNAMLKKKHGVLWAATNSGKTETAIAVIKALDLPTLFLVKGKDLVLQTYKRFQKRLGEEEIGLVMSNKWDVRKFTVASADTLARRLSPNKIGNNTHARQQAVKKLLGSVQVVIVDECHTAASKGLWNVVRMCEAPYRYGLSGTPFKRGDKQDLKLIGLTGEVCCKITNKEMIEDGVSAPTDIRFFDISTPDLTKVRDYKDVYDLGVVKNPERNRVICELTEHYYMSGKSVLVIVKKIDHGHRLDHLLYEFKEDAFVPHYFIHGDTPLDERTERIEQFSNGMTRVLITSSILDQGVDIPNIDVLIFAAGGNSYIRAIQRVGRGLRMHEGKDKLTVIDFCDRTNKYLAKHSLDRIESYQKENCFDIKIVNDLGEL